MAGRGGKGILAGKTTAGNKDKDKNSNNNLLKSWSSRAEIQEIDLDSFTLRPDKDMPEMGFEDCHPHYLALLGGHCIKEEEEEDMRQYFNYDLEPIRQFFNQGQARGREGLGQAKAYRVPESSSTKTQKSLAKNPSQASTSTKKTSSRNEFPARVDDKGEAISRGDQI